MRGMRRMRLVLSAVMAGGLLLLFAGPASAEDTHIGLHDMNCTGITAMGKGLPASTTLGLTLLDAGKHTTLTKRSVRTSADGMFETRLPVALNQVLTMQLQVTGPGGKRIGFAEHAMEMGSPMCDLPFTGPKGTTVLLTAGLALLCLGTGVLVFTRHRPAPFPNGDISG